MTSVVDWSEMPRYFSSLVAGVDDLVRHLRALAGRRGEDVARLDRIGLGAEAVGARSFENDEQLVLDVVDVERERLLARRNDRHHATDADRADARADGGELRLEGAVRAFHLAQRRVVDVDDRLHPTLPSSEIAISFCASTANSIGSCCSTSRTKPLTISAVASSADRPRCRQ